jgi:hypothetical protein
LLTDGNETLDNSSRKSFTSGLAPDSTAEWLASSCRDCSDSPVSEVRVSGDELRCHLPFHAHLLELFPAGPPGGWFLEGQSSRGSALDRLLSDWILFQLTTDNRQPAMRPEIPNPKFKIPNKFKITNSKRIPFSHFLREARSKAEPEVEMLQ